MLRDFQRVRGVHRPFEYSRCSALHACHVKITYRLSPLRLSWVNNLPPVCKLIPPILSTVKSILQKRREISEIFHHFLFFFLWRRGKKRGENMEQRRSSFQVARLLIAGICHARWDNAFSTTASGEGARLATRKRRAKSRT